MSRNLLALVTPSAQFFVDGHMSAEVLRVIAVDQPAGLMVHRFTKWLCGLPVDPDLTLNLLGNELTARG